MHKIFFLKNPAISANETKPYPPYTEGVKKNVWIKNNQGDILFGKVLMTNNGQVTLEINFDLNNKNEIYQQS